VVCLIHAVKIGEILRRSRLGPSNDGRTAGGGLGQRMLPYLLVIATSCSANIKALAADDSQPVHATRTIHGAVMNDAPLEWVGFWSGVCRGSEHDLLKTGGVDHGNAIDEPLRVNLELGEYKGGLELRSLLVSELSERDKKADDEPDIEFSHHGTSSRLVVRNGAKVVIRGNARIGGATVSGPGASIVISGNAGMESGDEPAHPMIYNNGGMVIGGTASFQGHHFKADDGLAIANTATIRADRVDLDNKTYYPNGKPIYVTGRHESGYMIAKLGGESMEALPTDELHGQSERPVRSLVLLSDSKQTLESRTKRGDDGDVTQETLVAVQDRDGNCQGYQRLVSKFSATSGGRAIAIDIQGENLDLTKKPTSSFSIAGALAPRK